MNPPVTLPAMVRLGHGEFIRFASIAGLVPIYYVIAYNASSSAVMAYTEVLVQEDRGGV